MWRQIVFRSRAGVGLIAYTSAPKADTSALVSASDHKATEAHIHESGLPFVFLRSSWYLANHTDMAAAYVENGVVLEQPEKAGSVPPPTRTTPMPQPPC